MKKAGETMARSVEEIQRELSQAKSDLSREEAHAGTSSPSHPRVGQYAANVDRLQRELEEARRERGY